LRCEALHAWKEFGHHTGVIAQMREHGGRDFFQVGHVPRHAFGVQHGVEQVDGLIRCQLCDPRHQRGGHPPCASVHLQYVPCGVHHHGGHRVMGKEQTP